MIEKETIKNWFKSLKWRDYLIAIFVIASIVFGCIAVHYHNKANDAELALLSQNDSTYYYYNKYKEEYLAKNINIQTIEEIKKRADDLSRELASLKENPIVITKTEVIFQTDTVYMQSDSIVANDSTTHNLFWHYTEPAGHFNIAGNTLVHNDFSQFSTKINQLQIPASITLDIVESKDGLLRIITKSDNPYISLSNVDGVFFDPTKSDILKSKFKRKRWNIGPMVGFGVAPDGKFRPYLGIGLTYGLIAF